MRRIRMMLAIVLFAILMSPSAAIACFTVDTSGPTWTAVPPATDEPSSAPGIDPLTMPSPACATCWPPPNLRQS
jgi:hypothetical protein